MCIKIGRKINEYERNKMMGTGVGLLSIASVKSCKT